MGCASFLNLDVFVRIVERLKSTKCVTIAKCLFVISAGQAIKIPKDLNRSVRITSITPMKNEAPFLLEWVAYHHLVGVNDIVVFSNHCTDGTNLMLERLDEMGLLRHYCNPSVYLGRDKHHLQVIRYVNTWDRLRRSDWVVCLDVDEFICVGVGQGRLQDLFAATPEANMICMSQQNFGSGGIETFDVELTTHQFRQAWSYDGTYYPRVNKRGIKTLTHYSSEPRAWHNHSPIFFPEKVSKVHPVNGSGEYLAGVDITRDIKGLKEPNYGFDLVQLNHYAIRSAEAFLLKISRGNANHVDTTYGMSYWRRHDRGRMVDDKIQRWTNAIEEKKRELLQDPELARLEYAAIIAAKKQVVELRKSPSGARLLKQIRHFWDRSSDDGKTL